MSVEKSAEVAFDDEKVEKLEGCGMQDLSRDVDNKT